MHGGFWATRSFPPASSLTAGSLRCCVARCLWNKSCKTHSDTWHLLSQWPGEGNYDRPSTCTDDWPLLMKPRPNLHIFEFQNAVKCWSDGGAKSQTSHHTKTVLRVVKRFSKDLRWSHCETGRLLEQRPQGHHGLSPIVPFFYDVPPLGGVWGILRPGRWSHHGVNRCWWCMRDITSTSKPPALLSYFFKVGLSDATPKTGWWSVSSLFSYKIMASMPIAETSKSEFYVFSHVFLMLCNF